MAHGHQLTGFVLVQITKLPNKNKKAAAAGVNAGHAHSMPVCMGRAMHVKASDNFA